MKRLLLLFFLITGLSALLAQAPPQAPANLKAQIEEWMGMRSITLTWSATVTGKTIFFNIYRKTNGDTDFIKFHGMHSTMFKDKFVFPNTVYSYYVTAENSFGESLPSDTVSIEINDTSAKAFVYGTVTDDETGKPVHAMVDIVPVLGWSFRHLKTDSSGNYAAKVGAGKYYVSFAARGYYQEFYNNAYSIFDADRITLNENDSVNLSAGLKSYLKQQKFVISGTVTNNSGEGLPARIQLVILNRGMFDHHFKGAVTDSLGNYSLAVADGDSIALFAMPLNRNYLPEFFNDKKDFTEADKFVVHSDLNNIDFVLEAKPVYNNSLAGKVSDENGEGLTAAVTAFKLRDNNGRKFTRTVVTDSLGLYKFENLNPGEYLLLAVPIGGYLPSFYKYDGSQTLRWRDADSVVINESSELTGYDFNLLPVPDSGFARVNGVIKDGSGAGLNGAIVYVLDENSAVTSYATTDENGNFTIDNLAPGNYKLNTTKYNYESSPQTNISVDYINSPQQSVQLTMVSSTSTSVGSNNTVIRDYALFQNYPNPFNPTTTIKYQTAAAGNVTLKVYNLIGQEIATLIDSQKPAGEYTVTFNAGQLNSGIYFYKLNAGNKVYTRKMIILK